MFGRLLADRLGTPEDVAGLAVFVASDDAAWLTGVDILMTAATPPTTELDLLGTRG